MGDNCHCRKYLRLKGNARPVAVQLRFLGSPNGWQVPSPQIPAPAKEGSLDGVSSAALGINGRRRVAMVSYWAATLALLGLVFLKRGHPVVARRADLVDE
jgi:hypothetical protein